MDPSTRFDDEAIRRILNRAAERQEQAERALPAADRGSRSGPEAGLTLAELQEVAGEVGITPDHVFAAAREVRLRAVDTSERYAFLGIPKETIDRRIVPGVLGDRAWERMVGEVRSEFRVPGVTNSFGSVREWWASGSSSSGVARLRLEPGEGTTEVVVRCSNRNMQELTHVLGWTFAGIGGLFGAAIALGGMNPKAIVAPIIFGGFSLATFAAGRFFSRISARRNQKRFARLLDRIELIARQGEEA
jgi:hypothetical protein